MVRLVFIALLVLWTTARHEGSHALAAWAEGAEIEEVRLLPGVHPELGFYFGYVQHSDDTTWRTDAAPFVADLLLLIVALAALEWLPGQNRYRIALVFFGVVSPLADLAYNYQGGLWRAGTDVADLFVQLPDAPVHVFFITTMAVAVFGLRRPPPDAL